VLGVLELRASVRFRGQPHSEILVQKDSFERICERAGVPARNGERRPGVPLRDVPDGRADRRS
jgi:hypothetical protein